MSDKKSVENGQQNFNLAMRIADETQRRKAALLSGTELAKVPHTPENEDAARKRIDFLNDTISHMLRLGQQERGMYLLWFRNKYSEHGTWEKFCREFFPQLPQSTIRRCILAYRVAIGEKKPRELTYGPADVEDAELAEAACDPDASKGDLAPRSILIEENRRLKDNKTKGAQQLADAQRQIEDLKKAMADLKANLFSPVEVRDEEQRLGMIRSKFGEFLIFWHANFSHNLEAMRMHKAFLGEATERLSGFWEEQMLPHCNEIEDAARAARGNVVEQPKTAK
jgi:hypothetical protein